MDTSALLPAVTVNFPTNYHVQKSRATKMGKCAFRREWLSNPLYSEWLAEHRQDRYKAFCAACKKDFSLGTMGEYALKSHAAGKSHENNLSVVKHNTKLFVSHLSTPAPAPTAIVLPDLMYFILPI